LEVGFCYDWYYNLKLKELNEMIVVVEKRKRSNEWWVANLWNSWYTFWRRFAHNSSINHLLPDSRRVGREKAKK